MFLHLVIFSPNGVVLRIENYLKEGREKDYYFPILRRGFVLGFDDELKVDEFANKRCARRLYKSS